MKVTYDIREIDKETALEMIQKYHYSRTLPKLNKHFIGFYVGGVLCGVVTLGWGTRPLHTIKKLFPSLESKDYYEIGRMCMTDEMPRNSESQMLSQLIKYLKKNYPQLKVLFTWADGMLGKVGYVYQASNFTYAGYVGGEMYLQNGFKIHVRQTRQIIAPHDKRLTVRPTLEQMQQFNIRHYKGKQYRYFYLLGDRKEQRELLKECLIDLNIPRPKDNDLKWYIKSIVTGKWEQTGKPPYKTDLLQGGEHERTQKKKKQNGYEYYGTIGEYTG
jgi:hypothetical protein